MSRVDNFQFFAPTKILFGENQIEALPQELSQLGKTVLLAYGGGSIKKNGIYQTVKSLLEEHSFQVIELAGIEPNPRVETVRKGAKLCHEHQVEVILAVGGGSTIDCAKAIAAAYYYDGDPWEFTKDRSLIKKALPVATVLTMAATGSEMNAGAVITNLATNEKLGTGAACMKPKVSVLDPTYTYSVPRYQTAAGSADMLSHLIENYFSPTTSATLQDHLAEGIMKTVIEYCPKALKVPEDYEARANLMWSSSLALNGLTGSGKAGSWSCHPIEHELSAYYDITHGIGLAIITPRWMEYVLNDQTVDKFVQFATNVWGIPYNKNKFEVAKKGIQALYDCFVSWGIPMTLPEVGIDQSQLKLMSEQAIQHSQLNRTAYVRLEAKDVEAILMNCF